MSEHLTRGIPARILGSGLLATLLFLSPVCLPSSLSPQFSVLSPSPAWAGELRSSDIVHYIRQVVQLRYQVPGRDIAVVWKDGDPAAKVGSLLDSDKITYRIQDEVQSSLVGRDVVPISFYTNNRLLRTVFFKVRVDAYKTVVVASERIAAHEAIDLRNTRLHRVPVTQVPAGALHNQQILGGNHARRALAPNTILTDAMVDAVPTVRRGSPVTLQVVNGALSITTEGIALSDGFIGQTVKVQNSVNGQTVYATVVSSRQVRITMEGENYEE